MVLPSDGYNPVRLPVVRHEESNVEVFEDGFVEVSQIDRVRKCVQYLSMGRTENKMVSYIQRQHI